MPTLVALNKNTETDVRLRILATLFFTMTISACHAETIVTEPILVDQDPTIDRSHFDKIVPALLSEHEVAGVGIGIIRNDKLVWTGYYGEQGPGIPVTDQTVFNTASVAKTITAETMIALAAKKLINLDEPIASYVQYKDLSKDERYQTLTARILLSHRGGLLNWAYEYDDNKLAFDHNPDTRFSYSGAGIQLAAEYAEAKLGVDFEQLAFDHLLRPLGIEEISMGRRRAWMRDRLAKPMDAAGRYRRITKLNPGLRGNNWQASDDLLTTVKAYAKLLEGLARSEWLSEEWVEQRTELRTHFEGDPLWGCEPAMAIICPDSYGHGIGWQIYRYGDHTVLKHSGNDAGENALVYYSPTTRNGAVIAVNGANGWFVSVRILELIGDEPLIADYYRALIQKHYGLAYPPLEDAYPR